MNYSDQILESKTFNFFKQLTYNIALAICIMLLGVLVLVYGFKFNLYNVKSDSQYPYYVTGDMVVVKAQEEYKVGDIIKFDETANKILPTTHRLIYILEENGKTYYICHGDALTNLDFTQTNYTWEDDHAIIANKVENEGWTLNDLKNKENVGFGHYIQTPQIHQIEGKVIAYAKNYGTYFAFIKEHYMLFIALVAGVWCVSSVIQNELEIKRSLRLF